MTATKTKSDAEERPALHWAHAIARREVDASAKARAEQSQRDAERRPQIFAADVERFWTEVAREELYAWNKTGQALAANSNTLKYRRHNEQGV